MKIDKKNLRFLYIIVCAFLVVVGWFIYKNKLWNRFSIGIIKNVSEWITSFGWVGVIVYITIFALATIIFLPGLPFTLLGGLTYGTIQGIIFASIGDILGTVIAFLIARYGAKERVANWLKYNETYHKVNNGVREQGWRIIVVTRLVPIFPHSVQNYAYGLTAISIVTYGLVSYLCLLPGTAIWIFAINTVGRSGLDPKKMVIYVSIAGLLLVSLSYLPRYLYDKKYKR